jgi:hypothetical protein
MLLLESLVGGIVEGVAASILEQLFGSDREVLASLKDIQQKLTNKQTEIKDILQKASVALAKNIVPDDKYADRLKQFLVSPEVESILRQIFAAHLASKQLSSLADLRMEFTRVLALFISRPEAEAENISDVLFPSLIDTCAALLAFMTAQGNISPSALAELSTNKMLLDELAGIQANFKLLSQPVGIFEIEVFEK